MTVLKPIAAFLVSVHLLFTLSVSAQAPIAGKETDVARGPTVQDSLDSFVTQNEVRVQAAASEPSVVDPVAIRFDGRGRMWVVEMRDYPTGPPPGRDFNGSIKVLTDQNQDGVYETVKRFAQGLMFPTGLQPWRDGVIVTLSGKIQYLADTDGDGRCDVWETWFEGFSEGNEQLRANHPVLGPDGLVYVAGGLRGGKIRSVDPRWPRKRRAVDIMKTDFAFDPCGGFFGAVAGNSQHGLTIDDFGHRVGCSNRNPAIETLLDLPEIRNDRWSSPQDALHDVGKSGMESQVTAIAKSWTTSHTHTGQFSAACGITAGLGTQMPARWKSDFVICEPTAYAIQRQSVQPLGIGRQSERVDDPRELISSRNDWFRPVDTIVGLDGALYVVDMCRAVIEHPNWAPAELKERPDERWGNTLGRIWRLSEHPGNQSARIAEFEPTNWTGDDWAAQLDHPNPAIRQIATQWFVEQEKSAVSETLLDRWNNRKSLTAAGTARLAQLLDRSGLLASEMAADIAKHPSPRVRRMATRLLWDAPPDWQLLDELLTDQDVGVRYDALRLAGSWFENDRKGASDEGGPGETIVARIADVVEKDASSGANQSYWLARLGCLPPNLAASLAIDLVNRSASENKASSALFRLCRSAAFAQSFCEPTTDSDVLSNRSVSPIDAIVFAAAWSEAHRAAGRRPMDVFQQLRHPDAIRLLQTAKRHANHLLGDSSQSTASRLRAIETTSGFETQDWKQFLSLLRRESDLEIQKQLVPLLFAHSLHDSTVRNSLAQWFQETGPSMEPVLRASCIKQMVRDPFWMNYLLDLLEQQTLPITLISIQDAERLVRAKDAAIASRASKLLKSARQDRLAVIKEFQPAISGIADLKIGQALFRQHCSACHRIADIGIQVGPDISDSRTKTPLYLLTAILDPNAAVDAGFLGHQVLTADGQVLTGMMLTSADTYVTLQLSGGERKTIDRNQIEMIKATGESVMPEGFERSLTIAQMRNLIGYLKGWRYLNQGQSTMDLGMLSLE